MNPHAYFEIEGKDCSITLERAVMSSRGLWCAKLFRGDAQEISTGDRDEAWPRYYFSLIVAKEECIQWMKANKVLQRSSHWKSLES